MSVRQIDAQPLATRFISALNRAGFKPAPQQTVAQAMHFLSRQPCESDFVVGDCNSPENAPFLADVTGGEPCWPCYARRVLKAVKG